MTTQTIISGLVAYLKAGVPGVHTVDVLQGSYESKTLQQLTAVCPFILVRYSFGTADRYRADSSVQQEHSAFVLYVGAKSLRSGIDAEYDALAMMDAIRTILSGKRFDTEEGKSPVFRFVREELVASEPGIVVYEVIYETFKS